MKYTLITGGAKGIGAAIALALAEAGHPIVIHYRNSHSEAQDIAKRCQEKGVEAHILQGDFSHQEGLVQFMEEYQRQFPSTFGLVHNVGNYLIKPASHTSIQEWSSLFQTNLFAPIFLMNALKKSLLSNQGRVVALGTVGLTSSKAYTKAVAYSVSKVALYQAMLSYAKEWAKEGVTVNMVSPGIVETSVDLQSEILPKNRPATTEEIARVISFLFAPKSSYITGQNIEIAGAFGL